MTRTRQPGDADAGDRTGRTGQQHSGTNGQTGYAQRGHGTGNGGQRTNHGPQRHGPGRQQADRTGVPTGLHLVAITMGAVGGLLAVGAWLLFTGGSDLPGSVGTAVRAVGLVAGVLGGVHLLAAYGLWTVAPWGRRLALVLAVGTLLASLLALLNGGSGGLLGVLLYGGTSWYLHTSKQRYRFLLRRRPA